MTQEDKELLLKDLCARLPYGVRCQIDYDNEDADLGIERYGVDRIVSICIETEEIGLYGESAYLYPDNIKPYLFPISSMTEKQEDEYVALQERVIYNGQGPVNLDVMRYIDWCYKNHIDIRGLIEKGLAIDATGINIY